MKRSRVADYDKPLRRMLLFVLFLAAALILVGRAIYWQYDLRLALENTDNARYLRTVEIPAYRGPISDRNGNLLAVNAPVYSAWIDPSRFAIKHSDAIAEIVEIKAEELRERIKAAAGQRFLYIKRHADPHTAAKLRALKIDALYLEQVDKRFYPAGEITAHIIGQIDVDGRGIEGIEMNADHYLRATAGTRQLMLDANRRAVHAQTLKASRNGEILTLSIDQRIQYYAHRRLRDAIVKHQAESGSIVVVDAQRGEIIAAVNFPSFNPNTRRSDFSSRHRNRLLTDTFEPGSTIKPIIAAAVMDSGYLTRDTVIDTTPGYYRLSGGKQIRDVRNYGKLDITGILVKSSNVGISRVAQMVSPEVLWNYLYDVGFGQVPGTIFPGEAIGELHYHDGWSRIDHAVLAYGYSVAVSPLQLAMAYTVFANDGWRPNPTFIKGNAYFNKQQVFKPTTARTIREMLRHAVSNDGTGVLAKVKGFTTAGKTGTTRQSPHDKGSANEYTAVFVGFAPVQSPNFVCAVVINKPRSGDYYGGKVAAPVFSDVMSTTLHFMNFEYDEPSEFDIQGDSLFVAQASQ